MNLTDLRDELTTHADDLGTATDLRAGVAAKVTRTKRRRAVGRQCRRHPRGRRTGGRRRDVARPAQPDRSRRLRRRARPR